MAQDKYTCPITKETLFYAVLAEDGFFYEKTAIIDWLSRSPRSPQTNLPMGPTLITVHSFISELKDYRLKNNLPPPYQPEVYGILPRSEGLDDFAGLRHRKKINIGQRRVLIIEDEPAAPQSINCWQFIWDLIQELKNQ